MPPELDPFVVVVTLVTGAAVVASIGRQLSPALRRWQLGVLLLTAGPGLLAAARLLGAPHDVVWLASLVRVVLIAPALWLMWRYRSALTTSPTTRAQ